VSELSAQLAVIQAELAALETGDGSMTSGYDTNTKISILCASSASLLETPRVECLEHNAHIDMVLKAGHGRIPANYVAVDSGVSCHCAAE
jgi:hypothetical protein